jgi:hypothetical protein
LSNVIIGIIGIILFIGLAVAGAVLLGSDFQTARGSTQAATVSSHLQQFAQAVQVVRLRRGVVFPSNTATALGTNLVSYNALSDIPVNPLTGGAYVPVNSSGGSDANPTAFVYTDLGTTARARDVCFAVEEGAGNTSAAAVVDTAATFLSRLNAAPRLGCMKSSTGNRYLAYIPV